MFGYVHKRFNIMRSKLENLFFNSLTKKTLKWSNYFDIYHKHFDKFVNKKINLLEIGIAYGGSLELWHNYFGNDCIIHAIDINPDVMTLNYDFDVDIVLGDQKDPAFWTEYLSHRSKFDVVIDDGGHTMEEQLTTLVNVFPHLNEGGVLMIEDTHTSYWRDWGGGLNNPNTFIEKSKTLIEFLHRQHIKEISPNEQLQAIFHDLFCVSFYNSVVVFEKKYSDFAVPVENK